MISTGGTDRLIMQGNYTSLRAGTGVSDRFDIDGIGAYITVQGNPVFYVNPSNNDTRIWSPDNSSVLGIENTNGIKINSSYYLPNVDGTVRQVLTTDGSGQSTWQTPRDNSKYSLTTGVTYNNSAIETSLIGTGQGSTTLSIGSFPIGASYTFNIYGTVRTNSAGQTIRFRLKSTSGTIVDTGIFSLSNLAVPVAFTLTSQFTYTGGTLCVGSVSFNWNGSSTNMVTSTLGTFNSAVAQTMSITAQWTSANVNNSIVSNMGTITRVY